MKLFRISLLVLAVMGVASALEAGKYKPAKTLKLNVRSKKPATLRVSESSKYLILLSNRIAALTNERDALREHLKKIHVLTAPAPTGLMASAKNVAYSALGGVHHLYTALSCIMILQQLTQSNKPPRAVQQNTSALQQKPIVINAPSSSPQKLSESQPASEPELPEEESAPAETNQKLQAQA